MTRMRSKSVFAYGCWAAVAALACILPLRAGASERVYQFRSLEDPAVSREEAGAFCSGADFRVNVVLAARLWVHRTRAADGRVMNETAEAVGTAYACGQITNIAFPERSLVPFFVKFNLASGSYTAKGDCTVISNNVPQGGIVLAGCNLKVTEAPAGVLGGSATSSSVFNPFRIAGFNTGSYWTLQLYDTDLGTEDHVDHSTHDHDMAVVEDTRTDQQILDAQSAAAPLAPAPLP